jgi:hypothetical protein
MTFWKNVKQGVSRAASEAEKQAKLTQLNFQVGEVETRIRRRKGELGDVALKLCREGRITDPDLVVIVQAISEEEARSAELREQMEQVRGSSAPSSSSSGAAADAESSESAPVDPA